MGNVGFQPKTEDELFAMAELVVVDQGSQLPGEDYAGPALQTFAGMDTSDMAHVCRLLVAFKRHKHALKSGYVLGSAGVAWASEFFAETEVEER